MVNLNGPGQQLPSNIAEADRQNYDIFEEVLEQQFEEVHTALVQRRELKDRRQIKRESLEASACGVLRLQQVQAKTTLVTAAQIALKVFKDGIFDWEV